MHLIFSVKIVVIFFFKKWSDNTDGFLFQKKYSWIGGKGFQKYLLKCEEKGEILGTSPLSF